MESEIGLSRRLAALALAVAMVGWPWRISAQEKPASAQDAPAQLELRRTLKTRPYQGQNVTGEERVVRPRDTLWRILVVERGLSDKRFARYVFIVTALNPNLKKADVLQVGDTLFIPIQLDELLGQKPTAAPPPPVATVSAAPESEGGTILYEVKKGDQLYKVLRTQAGIPAAEMKSALARAKALNPQKKNWETLIAGEKLTLPAGAAAAAPVEHAVALPNEQQVVGIDYGKKITVQENLELLDSVMKAVGRQTRREGEEVVPLKEGTVHIDRSSYPIVQSPGGQRAILDMQNKITAALKAKMEANGPGLPVVSVKKGASLHEAVAGLLTRLGFQNLPSNQPVVIQDSGVAVQVKGEWMVTSPEDGGAMAQVMVVSLTDTPGQTPDYLKDYLSVKGMSLKEILLPRATPPAPVAESAVPAKANFHVEKWPESGAALVDALLADYGIATATGGTFSIMLRDGIRMDSKADRIFEYGGKKIALAFRSIGDESAKSMESSDGMRVVELDFAKLTRREIVGRLLGELGETAPYREQRFAANDRAKDKLMLTISGYYLPQRLLLLTDRDIPTDLERFFGEKGMRVVKF
ncbi:MAG TPA: hypothetical protein VL754_04760 [Verrucomicrobiae bacterium]|nr:hypothetical protein [Verrucomicrobiae bacterium]